MKFLIHFLYAVFLLSMPDDCLPKFVHLCPPLPPPPLLPWSLRLKAGRVLARDPGPLKKRDALFPLGFYLYNLSSLGEADLKGFRGWLGFRERGKKTKRFVSLIMPV